ncbi:MAG: alpha/beta hydrolase [Planctomycetota bacterium]
MKARVFRLLLLLVLFYATLCVALYVMQARMLFPMAGMGRGQPLPDVGSVDVHWLTLGDGTRVRAAVANQERPKAWMLFFVGNGQDLRSGVYWAQAWRAYDVVAVVPEYPGYGDSEGAPCQASLVAAAHAAAAFAAAGARRAGVPLVVAGASLGSYPAVQLAAEGIGDRLLLLAPFTSVREVAVSRFWFMPVRWLLRHPLDNLARAAQVVQPALVLHGDTDDVIPVQYGRTLATALRARFVLAAGCGHNDLPVEAHGPFGGELRRFLHGD